MKQERYISECYIIEDLDPNIRAVGSMAASMATYATALPAIDNALAATIGVSGFATALGWLVKAAAVLGVGNLVGKLMTFVDRIINKETDECDKEKDMNKKKDCKIKLYTRVANELNGAMGRICPKSKDPGLCREKLTEEIRKAREKVNSFRQQEA